MTSHIVHIGFGNMVSTNMIKCVFPPTSANAKRIQKASKDDGTFLDMTSGHTTKSLLLMQDGSLISCALSAKTIASRINNHQEEE